MRKLWAVAILALLPTLGGLSGCGLKPPPALVAAPDFTPAKAAIAQVAIDANATKAAADEVHTAFVEHAADTRPASAFIAEETPAVAATTQAAKVTVDDVAKITPAVAAVEKEAAAVVKNAAEQHKSAVDSQDALKKEKNSWFGGKLGHLLSTALWVVGIGAAVWGLSRVLLLCSPVTAATSIVSLDTPIHILANIVSAIATAASVAFGVVVRGVKWVWDEIALAHIPWPTAPVAAVQSTGVVSPATAPAG